MGTDLDNNAANRLENQLVDYRGLTGKQVSVQEGQREHWRQAIAALPQEFHVLISMQLQGKSHREIASRLGMARSTVTYRIKNATKLLRNTSVA